VEIFIDIIIILSITIVVVVVIVVVCFQGLNSACTEIQPHLFLYLPTSLSLSPCGQYSPIIFFYFFIIGGAVLSPWVSISPWYCGHFGLLYKPR
jgi:hypothetical protein